jgi:RNA polymerase sigma factor (sigma-70 family)
MRSNTRETLTHVVRRLAIGHGDEQAPDRDLLRRFSRERDEFAFATLVRRHGPMVLGVALRVLHQHQDAEDVCQATFLLLAQKAGTITWHDCVANWLYGVAHRLALKHRTRTRRRQGCECKARPRTPPDALGEITLRDLQDLLDKEVHRLPEKQRAAVILCCLEGKTRDEAARILGLRLSTVSTRLDVGRQALRRRLARRGVTLGLALVGSGVHAGTAPAAGFARFAFATTEAAVRIAAGEHLGGVVSGTVTSLVNGGMQAMFLAKLKTGLGCALVLTAACIAAWCAVPSMSAQDPPRTTEAGAARARPAPPQAPQVVGEGRLLLARRTGLLTLTPDGKEGAELLPPASTGGSFNGRLSRDGTEAAYSVIGATPIMPPGMGPEAWPYKIVVRKLGATEPRAVIDMPAQHLDVVWMPDGKRLLVTKETGAFPDTAQETLLLDPATGKTEPIDLPADVRVLDVSRDGKTFLVVQRLEKRNRTRLALLTRGDRDVRVLTELKEFNYGYNAGRLSPDGRQVLFTDADPADKLAFKKAMSSRPFVLDIATKKQHAVADYPENARALGVAWSPDGKRIAYTWMQLHPDLLKKDRWHVNELAVLTEAFLIVADADGRNARTVSSARRNSAISLILGSVDWR